MEWTSIPLAFVAGVISLLSPCVLPMIPAVTASAMQSSRRGLWYLAGGLALSFALGGTIFTYLLLTFGISPDVMRTVAVVLMVVIGITLVWERAANVLTNGLSRIISRVPAGNVQGSSPGSQFVVGASLGLVWLPCVGPTLGAAIALASTGNDMGFAFLVMLTFGIGTALPLIGIGYAAGVQLQKLNFAGKAGRLILGYSLLLLAFIVASGIDKQLEAWAIEYLPDWATSI